MLDSFSILTTSGVVLWSKNYEAAPTNPAVINSLISDVFIEERIQQGTDGKFFRKDAYTLKWRTQNDLGLIFIVGAALFEAMCFYCVADVCLHRQSISLSCSLPGLMSSLTQSRNYLLRFMGISCGTARRNSGAR